MQHKLPRANVHAAAAICLACAAFALGGSPRPEVVSLPILRGIAVLGLGIGLINLQKADLARHRFHFAMAGAILLLPLAQLVPLPPGVGNSLPGHDLVSQIDQLAALGAVSRPMTLTPGATMNALLSLTVPLAALLLAIRLKPPQHVWLASAVIGIGLASGIIAVMQILGDPQGTLYFYETTNNGAAVGLFANRNHQAVFLACLVPLLWAVTHATQHQRRSKRRRNAGVVLAGVAIVVPLILVTGSRAGLVSGGLGIASVVMFRRQREHAGAPMSPYRNLFALALVLFVLALGFLADWLQRAEALDRLMERNPGEDLRLRVLPSVWDMTVLHWPWGSGLGSFEWVYKIYEDRQLLMPVYMNHAHNDWLELLLTGGLPAAVLMALAVGAWLIQASRVLLTREADAMQPLRMAGLAVIFILALASLSDYPLRTPALACLLVFAAVWASIPTKGATADSTLDTAAL